MPSLVDRESDEILFPYFHFQLLWCFYDKECIEIEIYEF